jgi:hypothetical protein
MSVIIKSGDSTTLASVDVNKNLQVNVPANPDFAGFVTLTAEADPGDIIGSRTLRNLETTDDYRLRVGTDQTFFNEYFPGNTINGNIWNTLTSGQSVTSASNFANLNGSTTANQYSQLRTWRHMPAFMTFPTYCEIDLQFSQVPITNTVYEWGLGLATTNATPTDGAFFRITGAGEFRAILNTGGTEIQGNVDLTPLLPAPNTTNDYLIVLSEKGVEYWINDVLVTTIPRSSAAGSTTASMNLPIFIRQYNAFAATSASTIKVGYVNLSLGDMSTSKPWPHVMAGGGGMAYQGQTAGGSLGSQAFYANSVLVGAGAVMTNTTAALGSGLGGQFTALPSLAAGTDGIVCSYLVPAGTAALPGKSLYITGVKVHGAVTTALVGGPVLYAYSIAYGGTAVSLATTEANGTVKASRRIPLGFESFAATAGVGTKGSDSGVHMPFASPIIVQPGEYIQIAAKNLGTVTSSGTITFLVTFDAYME